MTNKINIIFFATPDIALQTFISLAEDENYCIKALVTQPPKPTGRGKKILDSNIKLEAIKRNIQVFEPEKLSKDMIVLSELKKLSPDFFVTFAFGQILSNEVLSIPKYQTINLHASLLPKYRGANPICECLLNGDAKTGVTTMITVFELDAGPICLQKEISLNENTNYKELEQAISSVSPELIKETLQGLKNGTIIPIEQQHSNATFTRKTQKSDKLLDFNLSAKDIHNKIRALFENNTAHFLYNNKVVKVLKSFYCNDAGNYKSGEIIEVNKEGIKIACTKGSVIITEVKPEGKNSMSAYSWSLGSKIKKGDRISCTQEG